MSQSLEQLDPNFKTAQNEEVLVWRDGRELTLEGQGWMPESNLYCRLPDRAQGVIPSPVWELSRHSAGVAVRFVTDATTIVARWTVRFEGLAMPHMPATGVSGLDLYGREAGTSGKWRWAGVGRPLVFPQNEAILVDKIAPIEREFCVYLPLYNGVSQLEIGVPQGAVLQSAPPATKKPICFYGTSIVHGGCASRPGMSYPALVGRHLDWPAWNLGFSGNGKSEPEVAHLLAELDAAVYVLDPLPNMTPELVQERMGDFVKILRDARPLTPIVMVENITYQNGWIKPENRMAYEAKNAALRTVFAQVQAEGVGNLHLVEGAVLLGEDGEGTVDGVHPTDVGFLRMAEAITPLLREILS